jgi:hypothetical protein
VCGFRTKPRRKHERKEAEKRAAKILEGEKREAEKREAEKQEVSAPAKYRLDAASYFDKFGTKQYGSWAAEPGAVESVTLSVATVQF